MKHRFVFALASASLFSAAAGLVVSCKSNNITQNNTENFDALTTATITPAGLDVDGPDNSHLHVPAGAVDTSTDVLIGKLHGGWPSLPAGWVPTGGVYSFEPHKQTFAKAVDIRVPYKFPGNGIGVRLVTAEPDGAWAPVDGAIVGPVDGVPGVFATTQSTHFSYFAVVTGAPPDPTIRDAGPDATIPDAAPDVAQPEAGPPPPPTLFVSYQNGTVSRFGLTPPVIVPAADAGADAGVDAGSMQDGGSVAVPANATNLAMSGAPYTLYAGFMTPQGGDGGPPPDAGVLGFSDPFGTPALASGFSVPAPGPMLFVNGELWLSVGNPPDIETFVNGTKSWPPQTVISNNTPYGGMAFEPTSRTLFLSTQSPDAIQRWTIGGSGASKQAVQGASITQNVILPFGLAVTPWGELLVVNGDNTIARFDLQGKYKSSWGFAQLASTNGAIAVLRWPNGGPDEMFIGDSEQSRLHRYVFVDGAHDTPVEAGTIALAPGNPITSILVAP